MPEVGVLGEWGRARRGRKQRCLNGWKQALPHFVLSLSRSFQAVHFPASAENNPDLHKLGISCCHYTLFLQSDPQDMSMSHIWRRDSCCTVPSVLQRKADLQASSTSWLLWPSRVPQNTTPRPHSCMAFGRNHVFYSTSEIPFYLLGFFPENWFWEERTGTTQRGKKAACWLEDKLLHPPSFSFGLIQLKVFHTLNTTPLEQREFWWLKKGKKRGGGGFQKYRKHEGGSEGGKRALREWASDSWGKRTSGKREGTETKPEDYPSFLRSASPRNGTDSQQRGNFQRLNLYWGLPGLLAEGLEGKTEHKDI